MKRACLGWNPLTASTAETTAYQQREEAGKELWRLLVLEYAGKQIAATTITAIAYWATLAGCLGVEDLAVGPSLAHKDRNDYVKLAIGKHYDNPDLYYCKVPAYEKYANRRQLVQVPMQLPSVIFKQQLAEMPDISKLPAEDPALPNYNCPKLYDHPVWNSQKADMMHWSRVIPCALYWDGVQYTKRDSFHALYLLNLRTAEKHVIFVVS